MSVCVCVCVCDKLLMWKLTENGPYPHHFLHLLQNKSLVIASREKRVINKDLA